MSEFNPEQDTSLLREWQLKIEVANRNNIFCHCRSYGAEWVDSYVERISCWQFPDD